MRRFRSAFSVEVFDQRNAKSDRLAAFLGVYVHSFGPEHRTNTNELLEFLAMPPPDRQIIYFGLSYKDRPCGFATFMYYAEGSLGIVDHLAISDNVRGYGAFFSFCDLIAGYFEQQRLEIDHVVAEVMLSEQQVASNINPLMLVRLMRLVGFKVAKVRYWAPDPMIVVNADECRAALLFSSQPERAHLPCEEFLRLVTIIYRKHYRGWYERTMRPNELEMYDVAADNAFASIRRHAGEGRRIALNGMKNMDLRFVLDPNPRVDFSALFYIVVVALPAAVGVAVAAAQERWVTIAAGGGVLAALGLFTAHPRLRQRLLRLFGCQNDVVREHVDGRKEPVGYREASRLLLRKAEAQSKSRHRVKPVRGQYSEAAAFKQSADV